MISVSFTPNVLRPAQRERWAQPCHDGTTVEDCIPPGWERPRPGYRLDVRRNGKDAGSWDAPLSDGDIVEIVVRPEGIEATVFIPLFGEVATLTGAAAVAAVGGALAAGAIFGKFVLKALAPDIDKPADPDNEAGTYGFGGVNSNRTDEGAPLPVVYGQHRVAGPVVGVWTRSDPGRSILNIVMVVAGHEVEEIGGITADSGLLTVEDGNLPAGLQIDNQPAENFEDVECFVRMGSDDQAPMPGFDVPHIQVSIGRTINPPDDSSTVQATPGAYASGDAQITKWTNPVSYTMGEEADEFLAEVVFPGGLYTIDADGDQNNSSVTFQGRYRRVDANGNPFGKYVVLPPFGAVVANKSTAFAIELGGVFIDPEDYTVPSAGEYLVLDGVNDYAAVTPSGISSMSGATTEITCFAWVQLGMSTASGSGTWASPYIIQAPVTNFYIAKQFAATPQGWEFSILDSGTTHTYFDENGARCIIPALQLQVRLADGTTTETFKSNQNGHSGRNFSRHLMAKSVPASGAHYGEWLAVAFTYRANDPTEGANAIRFLYGDGIQPHATRTTTNDHLWSPSTAIIVGGDAAPPSTAFPGNIDEVVLYQRALDPVEVAFKWNGGNGVAATASESGIIAGWHFDTDGSDFVGSNDLTLANGAAISSGGSPISALGSGSRLRGRYLIELHRLTDPPTSKYSQDEAVWENVKVVLRESQNFGGCAMIGLRVRWTDQLQGGRPTVTQLVKGAKVPVWDGVDEGDPNIPNVWTQNPAWHIADIALKSNYGLGSDLGPSNLNLPSFRDAAAYFDELVPDGTDPRDGFKVYAVTTTTGYPNGHFEFAIPDANWPERFGGRYDDDGDPIAAADSGQWFALTNVSGGAPAWAQEIEDLPLPVGEIFHVQATPARWTVRCHAPSGYAVALDANYDPAGVGEDQMQRYERRMQFDGVFDEDGQDAWTAMSTVARSARAALSWAGDRLTIYVDRKQDPSGVVTEANIIPGTLQQTWVTRSDRPNEEIAEYLDAFSNYEQVQDRLEHEDLNDPTTQTRRIQRRVQLRGIVRQSQVIRHLRHDLNIYKVGRRTLAFEVGPDQLGMLPGDVLVLSLDLPAWGISGRLIQDSPTPATSVFLDRDVTIASATNYEIRIRSSENGTILTQGVNETTTGGPGSYPAGSRIVLTSPFLFRPRRGDIFAWGIVNQTSKEFKVVSTSFNPKTFQRQVVCIEYSDDIYEVEGFASVPDNITTLPTPTIGSI